MKTYFINNIEEQMDLSTFEDRKAILISLTQEDLTIEEAKTPYLSILKRAGIKMEKGISLIVADENEFYLPESYVYFNGQDIRKLDRTFGYECDEFGYEFEDTCTGKRICELNGPCKNPACGCKQDNDLPF